MRVRRAAAAVLVLVGGCTTDSVHDLEVGDCLSTSDLDGDQVTSTPVVDCSAEHDAEIFGAHVFSGDEYPGVDAVRAESEEACGREFEPFIGLPHEESTLRFTMLYPSDRSWDVADDRTTLCIVISDEPLTGSLAGANV